MKLYIAVLDEFPDYMTPTLVAHAVLRYHTWITTQSFVDETILKDYNVWFKYHFKKVVVRVNEKEFSKIVELPYSVTSRENKTLGGRDSCVVWLDAGELSACPKPTPNVLKYAKLWEPK